MKKRGILEAIILVLILTINLSFIPAQTNLTSETAKIDNAYTCLINLIGNKTCSRLSSEEKIFSLLSVNKCKNELMDSASNNGSCWSYSSGECDVKTTAQAIFALDYANENVNDAVNWLVSQSMASTHLIWYLQIEGLDVTTCKINYGQQEYSVEIGNDKKISNNAGSCLSLAQDNYWFEISPSCYNEEFTVSCNKDFSTTLLFKHVDSPTIHIFKKTQFASQQGETKEKIESLCFQKGGICNYEGSLWATMVLSSLGKEVSAYLPYLIPLSKDSINEKFLPESFLYLITSDLDYKISLFSKQINGKWWAVSGERYYDTALALFPIQYENPTEKIGAKEWLLETQDASGCWQSGSLRNTAFILASIWPREIKSNVSTNGGGSVQNCLSNNFYCVSRGSCPYDKRINYFCTGANLECCEVREEPKYCLEDYGGVICTSTQICDGANPISSSDSNNCCVGGTCKDKPLTASECKINGGSCRESCFSGEEEFKFECDFSGDVCCFPKSKRSSSGIIWIILLIILIILVILGIIFKDKLRVVLIKMKSKSNKSGGPKSPSIPFRPGPGRPGHGGMHPRRLPSHTLPMHSPNRPIPPKTPERKIIPKLETPSKSQESISKSRQSQASKELNEVLKKLKEMGK